MLLPLRWLPETKVDCTDPFNNKQTMHYDATWLGPFMYGQEPNCFAEKKPSCRKSIKLFCCGEKLRVSSNVGGVRLIEWLK